MIRRRQKTLSGCPDDAAEQPQSSAAGASSARVVRISQVACPVPILKLQACLADIRPQECLTIIPGNRAVLNELEAACRCLGHPVVRVAGAGQDELQVTRAY